MIMVDIPEPRTCEDCPCSHFVREGDYEGLMMCAAMEFRANQLGFREPVVEYAVDPDDHRPSGCPIKMVTMSKGETNRAEKRRRCNQSD